MEHIHKPDTSSILQALQDLKLARSYFKQLISSAHKSSSVQFIPSLKYKEDSEGNLITELSHDDYQPQHIDFIESVEKIYDIEAPEKHAINSLPRYPGYVECKPEYAEKLAATIDDLNEKIDQFKFEVSAYLQTTGNEGKDNTTNKSRALQGLEVLNSENYELLTRHIIRSDLRRLDALKLRWVCNHYSQPRKLTIAHFIELIELESLPDLKNVAAIAIAAAKQFPMDALIVKRFYIPPNITAQYRYEHLGARGSTPPWENNVYPNTPIIIFGTTEKAKLKSQLPGLDVQLESGSVVVNKNPSRRSTKPLPQPLLEGYAWYVLDSKTEGAMK